MSKRFPLMLATAATLLSLALPAHAEDGVAAIVNGDKIYTKDVSKAIDNLPVKGAKADDVYPLVLDQIINDKLVDDAVAKAKITESEDFKKRLDVIKTQLAKQIYLENAVKDKISDKAVKAEYEKFKKDNKGKAEVHARHILVPSEEEARQVIKELDGGAKFAELAAKRSSGPGAVNGGDLGYFVEEEMVPEFSKAAFALKKGQYSKTPVKTGFGWHVILIEDRRTRSVPDLAQVEMPIRNKLGQEALQALADQLRAAAKIERFDLKGKPLAP